MNEPWFDPMIWSWVPGTVFGTLGGILGGVGGTLASSGRAKGLIMLAWWLFLFIAFVLLVVAIVAFASGQPYGIWYGLGLPGVLGLIVFGSLLPVLKMRYREAELRTIAAKDLNG